MIEEFVKENAENGASRQNIKGIFQQENHEIP